MNGARVIAAALALLVYTHAEAQNCTAELSWLPPTENTDGSELVDLAGFKVYWSTSSSEFSQGIQIEDPNAVGYVVEGLADGTWYFVATAYSQAGRESAFSNVVSKAVSNCVTLPDPRPPGEVTVQAETPATVFDFVPQTNRAIMLPVGTVAPGVVCIGTEAIVAAGVVYYAVPRELVTWAGTVRPDVVYTRCQ